MRKRNRVHFYVARDKSGFLALYLGKPSGECGIWSLPNDDSWYIATGATLYKYGLDEKDFENLSWENGPVEVFIKTD